MDTLVLTEAYAKIDRGHGIETVSREEYDALIAQTNANRPKAEPEAEPEPEAKAKAKAEDSPPRDKAVATARKK